MLPPTNRIISGISLPPTNAVEELQKPHLEDAVFERDKNETMVVEMIKMRAKRVHILYPLFTSLRFDDKFREDGISSIYSHLSLSCNNLFNHRSNLAPRKSSSIDNSATHLYAPFRHRFASLGYRDRAHVTIRTRLHRSPLSSIVPSILSPPPQGNARQHFRQPAAMTNAGAASSGGPAIIRLRLHRG